MRGRHLESLTWPEAEKALRDFPVALLPLGARTKEHGLHLPLNNDWIQAEYLTKRVLEHAPALALPALPYGYYPSFVDYPGSVSLGRETCRDAIVDIGLSLSRHGAKRFYVLNTGISTLQALEPARKILWENGLIMEYTDLGCIKDVERRVRRSEGGTHADEIETSMMLYIAPEIVRRELAVKDFRPRRGPGPFTRDPKGEGGVYSPSGAWGDPTLADAEKGRVVTEALIERIVDFLKRFTRPDYRPAPWREEYLA